MSEVDGEGRQAKFLPVIGRWHFAEKMEPRLVVLLEPSPLLRGPQTRGVSSKVVIGWHDGTKQDARKKACRLATLPTVVVLGQITVLRHHNYVAVGDLDNLKIFGVQCGNVDLKVDKIRDDFALPKFASF